MTALAFSSQIARHFGRAPDSYQKAARLQRQVAAKALSLLAATDGILLDPGCGPGWFQSQLKTQCGCLIALDLSYQMLQKTQTEAWANYLIQADAQQLPLIESSVDRVFSSLMLQWCAKPQQVLAEVYRVLKPGGSAVLTTLLEGTLAEFQQAWSGVDQHHHTNSFLPLDFYQLLQQQYPEYDLQLQTQLVQLEYADVLALARELKDLGANMVTEGRNKALTGKQSWQKVQQAYPSRLMDGQISASYQVLYLSLSRSAGSTVITQSSEI
jgi:malonyl-CoA O-methyltransferase